jgi:hypothetical protein
MRWGVGDGPWGRHAAARGVGLAWWSGRRGVAGSGPTAVRDWCQNGGGWGLTGGLAAVPGRRRFEYISNSNEFKLLEILPNLMIQKLPSLA